MPIIDNIPYELIAAYLAGETSEEQNTALFEWVDSAPENNLIFHELKAVWGASFASSEDMTRSGEIIRKNVLSKKRRDMILKPLSRVVCLVGAVCIGFLASLFINSNNNKEEETTTQIVTLAPAGEVTLCTMPGQKAEATLPDGTKVWLNSGTVLSYPAAYGIEARTATLVEGEVFMEVAKNEEIPFVLNTSNGFIKVYGTSFNVRNYSDDESMTISLKEGSIEYFDADNKSKVLMVPGQKIVLDKADESSKEQEVPKEKSLGAMVLDKCDVEVESVWRFGELKIERKSFMDVMAEMERWYGVEIEVSGAVPYDSYYWMTIKTESLREMLGLIQKITPFSYRIDGKDVSLKFK